MTSATKDSNRRQSANKPKPKPSRKPAAPATTEAQRRAAVILEVLAGVRTAQEASEVLSISSNHYYLLERKALAGLVSACEPAPRRGPPQDPDRQLKKLQQELTHCRHECQRQAALVRAAQRAIGLPVTADNEQATGRKRGSKADGTRRRRRRREPRALQAAKALRKTIAESDRSAVQPSTVNSEIERTLSVTQEHHDGSPRT